MNMGFWKTNSFKALQKEWAKKLEDSGFKDIEKEDESLSKKNSRTNAFRSYAQTKEFYDLLDKYLARSVTMSFRDRMVLTLYAQGIRIQGDNGIVEQTGLSRRTITYVLAAHRSIILRRC